MDTKALLKATGASRHEINDWIRRGTLKSEIEETRRGSPRDWTHENAFEIGIIKALSAAGCPLDQAQLVSAAWRAMDELPMFWVFDVDQPFVVGRFPNGEAIGGGTSSTGLFTALAQPKNDDEFSTEIAPDLAPRAVAIINLNEICRRIDEAEQEAVR